MDKLGQLQELFQSQDVVVMADDQEFLKRVNDSGLATEDLGTATRMPTNVVAISFSDSGAKRVFELADQNHDCRCVFCAAHVFDNSLEAALYSLDLMKKSDFRAAAAGQKPALDLMQEADALRFNGENSSGRVELDHSVDPYGLNEETLSGAFVHSVAEFFEVHYAHVDSSAACPFTLNGHLSISGILSVMRPTGELPYEGVEADVRRLVADVASANRCQLDVDDNRIRSFMVDGQERVALLDKLAGKRGAVLTEFAIGVNKSIGGAVDYAINSQLNEGVDGIHVAVGDGSTGFHIDFLCPGATVAADKAHQQRVAS